MRPPPRVSLPLNTTIASTQAFTSRRHLALSFASQLASGIPQHPHSFPPLLKASVSLGLFPLGLFLHQQAVVHGFISDSYVSSSLLNMYAKFRDIGNARRIFDHMPVRNVVPWSAIIGCYSQADDVDTAFSLYNEMRRDGVEHNSVTLLGLLSGVSEFVHLQCLHACAIWSGFELELVLVNSILNVYARLGRVDLARRLFDSMPLRDVVSWNSIIAGYSRIGETRESMGLLRKMRLGETLPDHQTYGPLVSAITNSREGLICSGILLHALVITSGFGSDAHVETALLSMYLKFGCLDLAFLLFNHTMNKDVVSWTAMISGLVQNGRTDKAVLVFHQMLRSGVMPATTTIASTLAACAQLGLFNIGASIHGYVMRRSLPLDTAAENSLITMYANCGHLKQCQWVFETMQDRDVVSWNAVVSGYAQNGHLSEAFLFCNRMRQASQRPDKITVVSLLQGCASLGALDHGKLVHSFIVRHELKTCISIETALVDMYAKCGDLEIAGKLFDLMPEKDLVSWSAIIEGYGNHGMGEDALRMYGEFLDTGMKPNDVVFLSVLSACSHSGLVSPGLRIFKSMEDFGVEAKLKHCTCIIDLLSRAGKVVEAFSFSRTMSPKPSADVLGILLDACRITGDSVLAEEIARDIIAMRPQSAGNYVQLINSYAAMSRWDGVAESWASMRSLGLKKAPGWSFIELNGNISAFFADHTSHPQYDELILLLRILETEMRKIDKKFLSWAMGTDFSH